MLLLFFYWNCIFYWNNHCKHIKRKWPPTSLTGQQAKLFHFQIYFTKYRSTVAGVWPLILLTTVHELHKRTLISSYSIYYSCTVAHIQTLKSKSFFIHQTFPHNSIVIGSNQPQNTFQKQKTVSLFTVNKTCLSLATRCHHRLCRVFEIHLLSRLSGFLCFKTTNSIQRQYIIYL